MEEHQVTFWIWQDKEWVSFSLIQFIEHVQEVVSQFSTWDASWFYWFQGSYKDSAHQGIDVYLDDNRRVSCDNLEFAETPAIYRGGKDMVAVWCKDGKIHRDHGLPAVITSEYIEEWKDGRKMRRRYFNTIL